MALNAEQKRLLDHRQRRANWKKWGPYISERAWGTVREDYSIDGNAWEYFPHDHARSRAYRWGEDGLAGICDRHQYICFALGLWNGRDPILKERLFGLNGHEGNHGEDVKEYYFYLDNTPTHSYMKMLYKYPHAPFPYAQLVEENRRRTAADFEFELFDTGVFNENRYFDVFLESIYHKLLLNFTWWVNKKDAEGKNIFQGGFLGLDNISVFDRSRPLPSGGHLDQSDATAWMGFYCLGMIKIATELAGINPVYQGTASKFFEHFLRIARAMTGEVRHGISLWDEEDGFFYDVIHLPENRVVPLKVRSMVGLIPLIAVEILDADLLERVPDFKRRMLWLFENRKYLRDQGHVACVRAPGIGERRMLSILNREKLERVLGYMLDENEFLSPYGIRSLSKVHKDKPYTFRAGDEVHEISYQPAESENGLFGGNSNWRGPVWFPINYLIVEVLQKFHRYYGDTFKVACPAGSNRMMNLKQIAEELSARMVRLFEKDEAGNRPLHGGNPVFNHDPHWQDLVVFPEYFHGDNGAGLGAGHQTGWTGLVTQLIRI